MQELNSELEGLFSLIGYCNRLESALYAKAQVHAVYATLIKGQTPSAEDVARALEGRCEEFALELDLSEALPLLCTHMRDYGQTNESDVTGLRPRTNTMETVRSTLSLKRSVLGFLAPYSLQGRGF